MTGESNIEEFMNWLVEATEYIAASKLGQGVIFLSQMDDEQLALVNLEADELFNKIIQEVFSNRKDEDEITPQDMADLIKSLLIKSAEYLMGEQE